MTRRTLWRCDKRSTCLVLNCVWSWLSVNIHENSQNGLLGDLCETYLQCWIRSVKIRLGNNWSQCCNVLSTVKQIHLPLWASKLNYFGHLELQVDVWELHRALQYRTVMNKIQTLEVTQHQWHEEANCLRPIFKKCQQIYFSGYFEILLWCATNNNVLLIKICFRGVLNQFGCTKYRKIIISINYSYVSASDLH